MRNSGNEQKITQWNLKNIHEKMKRHIEADKEIEPLKFRKSNSYRPIKNKRLSVYWLEEFFKNLR